MNFSNSPESRNPQEQPGKTQEDELGAAIEDVINSNDDVQRLLSDWMQNGSTVDTVPRSRRKRQKKQSVRNDK